LLCNAGGRRRERGVHLVLRVRASPVNDGFLCRSERVVRPRGFGAADVIERERILPLLFGAGLRSDGFSGDWFGRVVGLLFVVESFGVSSRRRRGRENDGNGQA
jgi:hypothetical protein